VDPTSSLTVSIPAPRELQDAVVRDAVAPLVEALCADPGLDALRFERLNKPDWRIMFLVYGGGPWLAGSARPLLDRRLGALAGLGSIAGYEFVSEEHEDKWVGGPRDLAVLRRIYHADTLACLELLAAEARGALSRTRAEWSLVLVERMLDLFGLGGGDRLEFYERGYRWAFDLGRWDDGVIGALEEKYRAQRDGLAKILSLLAGGEPDALWGGAEEARIALACLEDLRAPVEAILSAGADRSFGRDPVEIAVFVGHAHSNRLGIYATQEAVLRWLVRRAREDRGD
jgi:thiopeptide-type bacteriocin biosynthesis protein